MPAALLPSAGCKGFALQGAVAGYLCETICIAPRACALTGSQGKKWKTHTCNGPFFQVFLSKITHLIRGSQTEAAHLDIPSHELSNCHGIKMVYAISLA